MILAVPIVIGNELGVPPVINCAGSPKFNDQDEVRRYHRVVQPSAHSPNAGYFSTSKDRGVHEACCRGSFRRVPSFVKLNPLQENISLASRCDISWSWCEKNHGVHSSEKMSVPSFSQAAMTFVGSIVEVSFWKSESVLMSANASS